MREESLIDIGERFNIKTYSTVSSIIRRGSKLKSTDKEIKSRMKRLQASASGQ